MRVLDGSGVDQPSSYASWTIANTAAGLDQHPLNGPWFRLKITGGMTGFQCRWSLTGHPTGSGGGPFWGPAMLAMRIR
jgi:hypothetical protein